MKKLAVLLASLALVASACGDRGDDTSGGVSGGTDDASTETTEAGGAAAGDWGDLEGVCGPNEGGGEVAEGDDAQGVSEDEIVLGTVADPGFTGRPGLNQELFDAGDAFVDWCNAAGGINGKQLVLNKHDAKLTEYQPAIEAACETDFALVGGGAVQDNLWTDVGAECGLIDVAGFAVTPEKAGLSGQSPTETRNVQPVPNPGDFYLIGPAIMLQDEFPDAGARTGFMYSDFQTIISQKNKEQQAYESIGHEVVHEGVYNINGESNWKPFAQAIADDEVQFLKFIGEPSNGGALIQALDQIGYTPDVRYFETNFYDQTFLDAAGPAADGVLIGTAYVPLEEADDNPATALYIENLEAQGGKQAVLGMQSTSAWLLFATLAKQCDLENNLTRTCILDGAEQVTEWTGGGLHAPTNPAENVGSTCAMILEVVDGKFERFAPTDDTFTCDESFAASVDPG
jgi:ABC-type branched-subunit amino acid transport system substrate-binding protein